MFDQAVPIHESCCDCDAKRLKRELGTWRTSKFDNSGKLRAFREAVSSKYKTENGPDHMLMSWMVRHSARVVNHFQVEGSGRTPYLSLRGKD